MLDVCFVWVMQMELNNLAKNWSLHKILPCRDAISNAGYIVFSSANARVLDYKNNIDMGDLDVA